MVSTTLNTQGQVPGLAVRDVVRLLSFQLRGAAQPIDNGYSVAVRNYRNDIFSKVYLTRSQKIRGGTDLAIESGILKNKKVISKISFVGLKHLYITWDSPGLVSFCYSSEGRFTLINVSHDNGVFVLNSIDTRSSIAPENPEDSFPSVNQNRRTFYHIGSLFDKSDTMMDYDENSGNGDNSLFPDNVFNTP